jgi:hypothetical protein
MPLQPRAARLDRFLEAADAAELFGKRRERDRRRVRLDPTPQFLYARVLRHCHLAIDIRRTETTSLSARRITMPFAKQSGRRSIQR